MLTHPIFSLQAEYKQMTSGKRTLVSGYLVSWEASAAFPLAQIRASLGQAGDLATETQVSHPHTIPIFSKTISLPIESS